MTHILKIVLPIYLGDYLSKDDIPVILLNVWGQRLVLKEKRNSCSSLKVCFHSLDLAFLFPLSMSEFSNARVSIYGFALQ